MYVELIGDLIKVLKKRIKRHVTKAAQSALLKKSTGPSELIGENPGHHFK